MKSLKKNLSLMVIVKKIALILLKRCNKKKNAQLNTCVNTVSQNGITNLGFAFLCAVLNYKHFFFLEFVCII